MDNPAIIPDSFISTEPEYAEASALRRSSKDALVVPRDDIPEIIIRIVDKGMEAVSVAEVDVEGLVDEIEVHYLESDDPGATFKPVTRPGEDKPEVGW